VKGSLADAGQKAFPYTAFADGAQRMNAARPVVEVSDDRDALGIGSPHGEPRSVDSTALRQMSTELLVGAKVRPLGPQMNVEVSQCGCAHSTILSKRGRRGAQFAATPGRRSAGYAPSRDDCSTRSLVRRAPWRA